jgi:hypothetical protein
VGKQPYYDDEFDDKNDHPKEKKERDYVLINDASFVFL